MKSNLEGKTALIIGAADSLSKVTAMAFANEGANLLLAAREDLENLDETAHAASALGVRVTTQLCEPGELSQVQQLVQKSLGEFGRLDVLVNIAGTPYQDQSFEQISFESWKQKINSDITGSFFLCREVIPAMIERHWGRVINYGGLTAFRGSNMLASTTELGIVGLTRGIAREYGKYDITANCICPASILDEAGQGLGSFAPQPTDPLPRWGRPEEVAFLAVCLASEDSGYITGQCLLATGGKFFL